MPEPDKILEAEQSIQNIASELKRMRDATQLIRNAQKKADAVADNAQGLIEAVQGLIKATESFSSNITVDLGQKLNDLKTMQGELSTAMQSQNQHIQVIQEEIEEARISLRGTKIGQVTMIVFMTITLIMLLAILIKFSRFETLVFGG